MTWDAQVPEVVHGAAVVALAGELDLGAVDAICARAATALDQPGTRTLSFDISAVTFIDSSAIGAFIDVRTLAQARGASMELINVPSRIGRIIEITGLTEYLGVR